LALSRRNLLPALLAVAGSAAGIAYGLGVARLSFGPPLVVLGLGGMTLVLAALALYRVLDPLLRSEPDRGELPQAPVHLRELERDKQAVLKAIREIELDYQMRKIAEPDYRELLQRYRARAMRIIRELDAGENYRVLIEEELKTRLSAMAATTPAPVLVAAPAPAPAAPAATATCKSCGASNDGDALFCKKCGTKLERA
jgi:zinc ribbon protein